MEILNPYSSFIFLTCSRAICRDEVHFVRKIANANSRPSVTRLGNFWKLLTANFLLKSSQNIWWHFGQFLNTALLKNNHWCLWCQLLEKLGYCLFQNLVTLPATVTWWCSFAQAIYPIKFEKLCNFTTKII